MFPRERGEKMDGFREIVPWLPAMAVEEMIANSGASNFK